ncbi:MAG: hypothetical protein LBT66_04750 [Methanobrevibacter sp.]|nr:hypothetical protein [Candidatus Methanovirga meridionalis]
MTCIWSKLFLHKNQISGFKFPSSFYSDKEIECRLKSLKNKHGNEKEKENICLYMFLEEKIIVYRRRLKLYTLNFILKHS